MKRTWLIIAAVALLASCGSVRQPTSAPAPAPSGSATRAAQAESVASTDDAPELDAEEGADRKRVGLEDLVRTNNQFAFDLFKSLPSGNLVVSPHGVASSIAVAYVGAEGETAEQIRRTLRAQIAEKEVHAKFAQLHRELRKREDPRGRDARRGFRLRVVNGVWHDASVDPRSRFLRLAHNKHRAEIAAADFQDAAKARGAINAFVDDATGGKIAEPIGAGRLNSLTRLLLVDAAHYDAPWQVPFARAHTKPRPFHSPSGTRDVAMMAQRDRFAYLDGDGFSLVELPYEGGEVVATILVPDGDIDAFGASIDASFFQWMTGAARQADVEVWLPRFEIRTSQSLERTLSGMGMPDAFDPSRANFGALADTDPSRPLYIDDLLHEVWIRVDEDGTAANASTPPLDPAIAPTPPIEFHADRPFLFIVRDVPTGTILFLGRVVAP